MKLKKIYQLISHLSIEDRRKWLRGKAANRDYVRLFRLCANVHDLEEIRLKMRKTCPQLRSICRHLYNKILVEICGDDSAAKVKMLFKAGLDDNAARMSNEEIKKYVAANRFERAYEIIEIQRFHVPKSIDPNLEQNVQQCFQELRTLSQIRSNLSQLFQAHERGRIDLILRSTRQWPILKGISNLSSTRAQLEAFRILQIISDWNRQYEQSIKFGEEILTLSTMSVNKAGYIETLSKICLQYQALGNYETAQRVSQRILTVPASTYAEKSSQWVAFISGYLLSTVATGRDDQNQLRDFPKLWESHKNAIKPNLRGILEYAYAVVQFQKGYVDRCLEWINSRLAVEIGKERLYRRISINLLRCFILIEKSEIANDDFDRSIREITKNLANVRYNRTYQILLQLFKKLQKTHITYHLKLYQSVSAAITECKAHEDRPFQYFDFCIWVDSKIAGSTMNEVIQAHRAAGISTAV
ncbi:MAG: hypothetical protein AAGN35_01400 [Bacteroidota bacterium]